MTVAGSHNGGRTQVNLNFLQQGGEFPFINKMKEAQSWAWIGASTTPLTPDLFDSNGYWATPSVTILNSGIQIGNIFIPSQTEYPGNYVLAWDGLGTLNVSVAQGGGSVTTVSGSLSNLGGGSGRYVFSLTTATALNVSHLVNGSTTVTNIRLYNINSETAYNGGELFETQFLNRLSQGRFGVIRFLNWQASNITNVTTWSAGNRPTTYYSYNNSQRVAGLLCNSAGSGVTTNSGSDYSVSAPSTWVTSGGLPADKSTIHLVWNASSPTQSAVTFAGSGSPNITWTGHGLSNGNQIWFTNSGGTPPTGVTATTFGVLPSICYFVTVVDANTIKVSATSGGAVINFSTTGTGTTTGRTNVTLNVGSTAAVQVLGATAGQLNTGAPNFPVGGSGNSLATLVYDAALGSWIMQGGTNSVGGIQNGVPISVCLQLCAEVGAHPWFVSPPLACTPMTDWHTQLATYLQANQQSWMIPRIEGPNELWNNAGGYDQTGYAVSISQVYGWSVVASGDFHNWMGKAMSTIGQAVTAVLGGGNLGTKYHVICGVQTTTGGSASTSNPRLTSAKYVLQSPQAGYLANPAYQYVSHVACVNYITPSDYNTAAETTLVGTFNPAKFAVSSIINGVMTLNGSVSIGTIATGMTVFGTDIPLSSGVTIVSGSGQTNGSTWTLNDLTINRTANTYFAGANNTDPGTYVDTLNSGSGSFNLTNLNTLYQQWFTWAQGAGVSGGWAGSYKLGLCGYEGGYSTTYTSLGGSQVDLLRYAGKFVASSSGSANGLLDYYTTNMKNFVNIGGVFPSEFTLGGPNPTNNTWSALEDVYQTPNPPKWEAIRLFNARKRRLTVKT
jgi:hypothetical protein